MVMVIGVEGMIALVSSCLLNSMSNRDRGSGPCQFRENLGEMHKPHQCGYCTYQLMYLCIYRSITKTPVTSSQSGLACNVTFSPRILPLI